MGGGATNEGHSTAFVALDGAEGDGGGLVAAVGDAEDEVLAEAGDGFGGEGNEADGSAVDVAAGFDAFAAAVFPLAIVGEAAGVGGAVFLREGRRDR